LILKKKWNTYNNILDFSHCVSIAKQLFEKKWNTVPYFFKISQIYG